MQNKLCERCISTSKKDTKNGKQSGRRISISIKRWKAKRVEGASASASACASTSASAQVKKIQKRCKAKWMEGASASASAPGAAGWCRHRPPTDSTRKSSPPKMSFSVFFVRSALETAVGGGDGVYAVHISTQHFIHR